MKRVALAAFATAVLLPASAQASTVWTGVVVAKDGSRKAVVTASAKGVVRTLRAPVKVGSLRVGQRVFARARLLGDGTFASQGLRVTGHAAKARVRAVLVRYQRQLGRYLVSAGGSVFAIHARSARTTAAVRGTPQPGDQVVADLSLEDDGTVETAGLTSVGHVDMLELEGIFTGLAGSKLQVAVAHRGLIDVAVPAGTALPTLEAGDEITLVVSVGADGAFTLVSVDGNDRDHEGVDLQEAGDEIEVEGQLSSRSPLTVQPADGSPVTCTVPDGLSLDDFILGERVELKCKRDGADLVLRKLESKGQEVEANDDEDEEESEHADHSGPGGGEHADRSGHGDGQHVDRSGHGGSGDQGEGGGEDEGDD